ncbi:hypothetical protein SBA2_670052 [Acidobacteriia bacterium SbA2]|nr:hypothetical protein SBA2_670052 [Acidobacteriia bacterium SbA2]
MGGVKILSEAAEQVADAPGWIGTDGADFSDAGEQRRKSVRDHSWRIDNIKLLGF